MLQQFREGIGRWIAGVILGLIAVAFIFWGVDFNIGVPTFAAKVNGEEVPLVEFDRALQMQQAQYADLYRVEFTEDLQLELRRTVLERLVRNEALLQRVESEGYGVSDADVMAAIRARPEFQVDGEFSLDLYRARLLSEGMPPAAFEAMQREQLALIELQNGIATSAFYTPTEYRRYIELSRQRREVAFADFAADAFVDRVEISDEAVREQYETSKLNYMTEESVDLEYIELLGGDLAADIEVTDEALRAFYEEEQARFQTEEQRHARHILFTGDDAVAEQRAREALDRLAAGEDFEALAVELSDDGGTKNQGGDLGWVGRGLLVGPFEDALFAMEAGGVEGPVKTNFGYHLIKLDEVRSGEVQSFEQVRDELAEEYRQRQVDEGFYARATELADRAFDAYDELATVSAQLNLPLKTFRGFTRSGSVSPFTDSAPVVQAAFAPEVLEQGENSGPIELAEDHVLVLRVAAHHLPAEQPFEAVQERVRQELIRAEAQRLAADAAQAFIDAYAADADLEALATSLGGEWHAPAWIERTDSALPTQVVSTAFRLAKPVAETPTLEPVPLASGDFAVLLLTGVEPGDPDAVTEDERNTAARQLTDQAAMFELTGYAGEIRDEASVRIPDQVLNPTYTY
jgi:peptidyl-prolyl cis-trans isomerase D